MKKIKPFLMAMMMLTTALSSGSVISAVAEGETDNYNGTYVIRNLNSGIYLNVAKDGNVEQSSADDVTSTNVWKLELATDGYYKIYAIDSGKLLNADTASVNVNVNDASNTDNQLFDVSANEDGSFKLLSKANGKAVEVINAETTSGANVQQWEVNGHNCQNWELIPVSYGTTGTETKNTSTGTAKDYIAGDLNGDGKVNVIDLALAKKIALNSLNPTADQQTAGNVDGKAGISVADFTAIKKFIHTGKGGFIKEAGNVEKVYQASAGTYNNGYIETEHTGFTQESYLNLFNEVGSKVSVNVEVPTAGIYAVTVNYASGGANDRTVGVTTNNGLYQYTLTGKPTGDWKNWQTETIYVSLNAGMNELTFTSMTADGAPNMDSITVKPTTEKESAKTLISPIKGVPINVSEKNQKGVGIQMEYLNRGVSAAYDGKGLFVSWRILATDSDKTTFKLWRNRELVTEIPISQASNYYIEGGSPEDLITIDTYVGTKCTEFANVATMFGTKNSGQSGAYFDIPTQKPADQTMPDGKTCTYYENDCSVGDIDGDGQYEIFVKWDPDNSQDNSKDGYTGTTFFDCYRLDGTLVWRIDLGINIRSGAHYTQFLVYDFDGDGKCELICKTADGTKDGQGNYIGDKSKDYRSSAGRILSGSEYITLFDGLTGKALDTQEYDPVRGNVGDWGDTYGNRVDRFTACVAYLDGKNASACFGRGYYTRMAVAAWDVKNGKLSKRWTFDSGYNASTPGYGDGNHHILAADCDGDGKQEIVTGSAVIDDNGKLLNTTSNAHGDAVHIGDFVPSHEGLEIFQCLEDKVHPNGKTVNFGVILRDAKTGTELFRETAGGDTGRCIADNLIAGNDGAEMSGSHNSILYDCTTGKQMVDASGNGMTFGSITKWGQNSVVYWTDVLERAVLDRTMADQYGKGRVFTGDGVTYNNASKSNACLTCDLMGDWREEMIFRKSDGGLRVFTTTFKTEYPIYSLMHNPQYRVQVAAQNNGYNQPPHTDYFLGTGYDLPTPPTVFDYKAQ
ncbi:MAG: RICIN domain-containing protein [Oscillospiraceae bacterium]